MMNENMINEELSFVELTDEDMAEISGGVTWYKVDWNGKTGWVFSRYTRKAKY